MSVTEKTTMNILFVSSGNAASGISPLVKSQGDSLEKLGHTVTFFAIKGKGMKQYFVNIFKLRKFLRMHKPDVIHAHYGLCGVVCHFALLGRRVPLVISFMGDDLIGSASTDGGYTRKGKMIVAVNKWAAKRSAQEIIVKSAAMREKITGSNITVLPNGVDFSIFKPLDREEAFRVTGWSRSKKHVLFGSNPARPEKNYPLASEAFGCLPAETTELHTLVDIPHASIPHYMNAADVVVLSSFHEGSPNVVKEAMACNRPVVVTPVGDTREVIGDTEGCYVAGFDAASFGKALQDALAFGTATNGRENIGHLDAQKVALKLTALYQNSIRKCAE